MGSNMSTIRSGTPQGISCSRSWRFACNLRWTKPISWRDSAATNSRSSKPARQISAREQSLSRSNCWTLSPRPFDLDGHNVTVGTSIGIALAPENGADAGELLKKADLALYRAKSEGRNSFRFFDEEMSKDATARHRLLNDLRAALSRKEFELHYQPMVDAKTARPCGVEALVRWRHPVEGLLSPDRFIGLAEESGLMEPLGEWILEQACADAASWPEDIKVAVNLSAVQFRSGKLFDVILCALVESGLPPERLELEITESVLLQNKESYSVMIQQLKNIGISIVLDDFGTGYSSLSYLTRFPFDKIKIDKSFTQGLIEPRRLRRRGGVGPHARPRPRYHGDRRRRRNKAAIRAAACGRRTSGPRLLVRPAGSCRRTRFFRR